MKAIILSIGDELVLGQTVDTNSAWISQQLTAVGCDIAAHATVPDDQEAIENSIRSSIGMADVLILSGGIGPTEDDLTRQALAAVMGVPLDLNEAWLARLQEFFTKLGRAMPATNQIQAMIPRGATIIENTNGTAAGIQATLTSTNAKSKIQNAETDVFVMPGVPKEMKVMFTRDVLPHIAKATAGAAIVSRTLHTFGLGESWVAEKLGELMTRGRNPSVGTTVANGIVSLRVNSRFETRERALNELERTAAACETCLGEIIFGVDDETLPQIVGRLLTSEKKTVATAESCTGGLVAKMLTDAPGSSAYFKQGWITYSNEAKSQQLRISSELIVEEGAVSEAVAVAMAMHSAEIATADYAISITGIAGPSGGTPEKPVGTVWIALCDNVRKNQPTVARRFTFPGDRDMVRDRSAKMALTILRYHMLGVPMPF